MLVNDPVPSYVVSVILFILALLAILGILQAARTRDPTRLSRHGTLQRLDQALKRGAISGDTYERLKRQLQK